MEMKTRFFFTLTLLIVLNIGVLPCFAQYVASTQLKACEDWMEAREDWMEVCEKWNEGFHPGPVVFSPDLRMIAGSFAQKLLLWDGSTGEIIHAPRQCSTVSPIAFSPDGHTLVSAGHALINTLIGACVWNASTGETHYKLDGYSEETQGYQINDRAFSPDGRTIADGYQDSKWAKSGGPAGFVRLWDVSTGKIIRTIDHPSKIRKVGFSPDGRTLAISGGIIRLWDVSTGKTVRTIEKVPGLFLAFSPDCRTLLIKGGPGLRFLDVSTGVTVRTLNLGGIAGSFRNIAFSPDGRMLASAHGNKIIYFWDVSTGTIVRTLEGHTDDILSMAFSSDGRRLASVSVSATVLLWDISPAFHQPPHLAADVNCDGAVNIQDLVAVAAALGETRASSVDVNDDWMECPPCFGDEDVNGDWTVDIRDLVTVAAAFGETAAGAPAAIHLSTLSPETVQQWLTQAQQLRFTDTTSQRGIHFLEQLLTTLAPTEAALLANYPNPFNPETWIPYQLAKPAEVSISIYAVDGTLVRTLSLGHKPTGIYQSRNRAAYWDGKNNIGESVASGVYFYTLTAGNFTATRKMLIRK